MGELAGNNQDENKRGIVIVFRNPGCFDFRAEPFDQTDEAVAASVDHPG